MSDNRPAAQRWHEMVDKSHDCWLWTGGLDRYGYGKFTLAGRTLLAHRFGYELLVEPVEDGLELDHVCHSQATDCVPTGPCPHRRCVNPAHLEPVSHLINCRRKRKRVAA